MRAALLTVAVCLFSGLPAMAEESDADLVRELLEDNYYEVEFFIFERSAVFEANTREVLVHPLPQPYPARLMTLRAAEQPYGIGYEVAPMTRLCLTFPTLEYTIASTSAGMAEAETAQGDPVEQTPDGPDEEIAAAPAIEPQLQIDPMTDLLMAVADFEAELATRSNFWMDPEAFTLRREANQVRRRGGGRVLFHGRWLQPVPPRESPISILLGAPAGLAPTSELTGSVAVTLGRYLHFQASLNYTAPALGARPVQPALDVDGRAQLVAAPDINADTGYMTLSASRRMRSTELHYIDHPKLGIVVRIDPVAIPDNLLALQAALEESEQ
jgi:hypothetical protein